MNKKIIHSLREVLLINASKEIIAVLQLFYTNYQKTKYINLFAETVRNYISSLLYQHILLKKQNVLDELIKNYEDNGEKRLLSDILNPVLNNILHKYCDYEGASLFIWDSYMNHFTLIATTGVEIEIMNDDGKKDFKPTTDVRDYQGVYYEIGEGLTGQAAQHKKAMMYDNLEIEKKHNEN